MEVIKLLWNVIYVYKSIIYIFDLKFKVYDCYGLLLGYFIIKYNEKMDKKRKVEKCRE